MTKEEKYIARILLKNKIYECDGQAFEDLFTRIFQHGNPNFKKVKAQGSYGDRKNDGFDSATGEYYQVYAPEDLPSKESTALEKLTTDFEGLKKYWLENGFEINKFFFVVNDKYKGSYPTLYSTIQNLNENEETIEVDILRAYHLEDKFISIDENHIFDIVGFIPNPLNINTVDYEILNEVVEHILSFNVADFEEEIPVNPDFEKKIEFNNLSSRVASLLKAAYYQTYAINDFFELNSTFAKEDLRDKFSALYKNGLKEFGEGDEKNDQIFFYIRNKSTPKEANGYYSAVYVLMAHYFEYCDIFKPIE